MQLLYYSLMVVGAAAASERRYVIPPIEQDQLIRLSLWSRDRKDVPQAVASHESAQALHELSDVLPRRVHLTVPRTFRKPAQIGCVLPRANMPRSDVDR